MRASRSSSRRRLVVSTETLEPRAYFAIISKNAEGRPEVADFVAWLREESSTA